MLALVVAADAAASAVVVVVLGCLWHAPAPPAAVTPPTIGDMCCGNGKITFPHDDDVLDCDVAAANALFLLYVNAFTYIYIYVCVTFKLQDCGSHKSHMSDTSE